MPGCEYDGVWAVELGGEFAWGIVVKGGVVVRIGDRTAHTSVRCYARLVHSTGGRLTRVCPPLDVPQAYSALGPGL